MPLTRGAPRGTYHSVSQKWPRVHWLPEGILRDEDDLADFSEEFISDF